MAQRTYSTFINQDADLADVTVDSLVVNGSAGIVTPALSVNNNTVASVAFTVNAAVGNAITVNCQFNQANGTPCAAHNTIYMFLSDDALGNSIAGTAPDGGVAAGTDGFIDALTAGKSWFASSEADGDFDIVITESGTDTWYLVAVLPNGLRSISSAITFT